MRRRFLRGVLMVAAVSVISVPVTAYAQDSWVGTWRLNVAKSKYDPANLAPRSQTIKQEGLAGGGMKATVDGVDAQGKPIHTEQATMFDGKPSEIKGAPAPNTMRVYKRIDNRTYEYVESVGGKPTVTARTVVAADGKTRTITTTGRNAQGQTVKNVAVYERQ